MNRCLGGRMTFRCIVGVQRFPVRVGLVRLLRAPPTVQRHVQTDTSCATSFLVKRGKEEIHRRAAVPRVPRPWSRSGDFSAEH